MDDETDFLKTVDLFEGIPDAELAQMKALTQDQTFKKGEVIFYENEPGKDLYIIKSGEVQILKLEPELGGECQLATLKEKDWFGEMALFLSNRTATARALQETKTIRFSLEKLNEMAKKKLAFADIAFNFAKKMSQRIKETNESLTNSMKREIYLLRSHNQMSHLIVYLFFLLVFFFYTYKLSINLTHIPYIDTLLASFIVLCFSGSVALLIKKSGYPLKFYGLSFKNWKKDAYEGIVYSIPILIFMLVLKWVFIYTIPVFKGLPLFTEGILREEYLESPNFYYIMFYILLIPLQEFITRGCLQSSLQEFFQSKNRVFLANLVSNLLFLLFHAIKSFSFAGVAFLMGLFWGWLYSRQRSIVGCTVSHIVCGIWALGLLDYQRIWVY